MDILDIIVSPEDRKKALEAIDRLHINAQRMNTFLGGDVGDHYTTDDGTEVPSIRTVIDTIEQGAKAARGELPRGLRVAFFIVFVAIGGVASATLGPVNSIPFVMGAGIMAGRVL